MSSRETEDVHLTLLNKLLHDSGIECLRVPPESSESTISEGDEDEELGAVEEEELPRIEVTTEEEQLPSHHEEEQEILPEIFPTASLRRVLTEKERKIEAQNRIHVLPDEFKKEIDPQAIPKIASTPQQIYIEILGDLLGCSMYRSSLAEYWFLDTTANLLRRAQEDQLDRPTQALLMLWFCQWIKEIQYFDAANRQRMLKRFQDNMLLAARFIAEENRIPTPTEAGVFYKENSPKEENATSVVTETKNLRAPSVTFEGEGYECALMGLAKIIHYIYDLFSTDYQYDLIRSVFTHTPDYILMEAPYQIQNPKKQYAPLKGKSKKESVKKDSAKKQTQKGRKKDQVETEDYLHLMELKAKDERCLDEQEEIERELWNRKSHILPLSFAVGETFLDKYWPPPPPPSVHELVEPDPKLKGKQKTKK